jgi:hypothetical protein
VIRVLYLVAVFMGVGCAHHRNSQSAYAPPLAPPVYPQPQMATQPVVYPAAPGAPVMAAPMYAPPAGAAVAPAAPPGMAAAGVVPASADGSCPPCEGSGAIPVVYEGAMQTPPCPSGP